MDQRERQNPYEESILAALDGRAVDTWTALPAIIESYDAARQTVTMQAAIQVPRRLPDGSQTMLSIPLLLDCPVIFPQGGGVTLTFPLAKGDECLAVFAKACIDAWWQSGGVQPPASLRLHDLSDGFCLPGVRSQPRKLANVSATAAQFRTDSGTSYVEIDPADGGAITVKSPNPIVLDCPEVQVTHKLTVTGAIDGASTLHIAERVDFDELLNVGGTSYLPIIVTNEIIPGADGLHLIADTLTIYEGSDLQGAVSIGADLTVAGAVNAGTVNTLGDIKFNITAGVISGTDHMHVQSGFPHNSPVVVGVPQW